MFTVLACMHDSNACGNTYQNPNKELDLVYHFQPSFIDAMTSCGTGRMSNLHFWALHHQQAKDQLLSIFLFCIYSDDIMGS